MNLNIHPNFHHRSSRLCFSSAIHFNPSSDYYFDTRGFTFKMIGGLNKFISAKSEFDCTGGDKGLSKIAIISIVFAVVVLAQNFVHKIF